MILGEATESRYFPYADGHQLVGGSKKRDVVGIALNDKEGVVVKVNRFGRSAGHSSVTHALEKVQQDRQSRERMLDALRRGGTSDPERLVPHVEYVVHNDQCVKNGKVTIDAVQPWIIGSQPLYTKPLAFLRFSDPSLGDLRKLLAINFELSRLGVGGWDTVGSVAPGNLIQKFHLRHLFPVLFSANIIASQTGEIRCIDVGTVVQYPITDPQKFVRQKIHHLGSVISVAAIDIVLGLRSAKRLVTRTAHPDRSASGT